MDPNKEITPDFSKILEEHCYCPFCMKIAVNAVESECCGNIFCQNCCKKEQLCPVCDELLRYHPTLLMRKIIKTIPVKCIYECGFVSSNETMEKHYQVCLNRMYCCRIQDCNKSFKREELIKHVVSVHENVIVKIAENYDEKIHEKFINASNCVKQNFNTADDIVCNDMNVNNGKVSYVDEVPDFIVDDDDY